jgi:type I restriction enzyme, S subunit
MGGKVKDLPVGWIETNLLAIVDRLQYGHTAKASQQIGEPKFLRITDIQNNDVNWDKVPGCQISVLELERYKLEDGDIVFARSGSIEKAYRVSNPPLAVFASYLIRGKPFHKNVGNYLDYFVRSPLYLKQIGAYGSGIAIQNVNARKLGSVKVSIPPLNEQKRIVAKIEELQARSCQARDALETIPDLLEQLRQSILAAAFRGDLTRKWREQNPDVEPASELLKRIRIERRKRWDKAELDKLKAKGLTGDKLDAKFAQQRKKYKEPAPVDATDLPELPEGWCWVSLSSLSWGSSYGTSTKCDYVGNGSPVIRIPNVSNGKIEIDDLKYSLDEIKLTSAESLNIDDFLVIRTNGSIKLVGRCAIVKEKFERPTYFASYLIRYRLCCGQNVAKWVAYLWESPIIRKKIESLASTSAGQYNMNLAKLDSISLPIPPEKEIDNALFSLDVSSIRLNNSEEKRRDIGAQMTKLDQSILSKAFRGELVPQDPNDEPASVLLELIRQEKARQAAEKKAKPKKRGRKKQK